MKHKIIFFLAIFLCIFISSCAEHSNVVIVNEIGDLYGQKIGCVEGNAAKEFVAENIERAKIVLFKSNEIALEKLKKAEVSVVILERKFAESLTATNNDFAIAQVQLPDENFVVVMRTFDMKITNFWNLHDAVGADF